MTNENEGAANIQNSSSDVNENSEMALEQASENVLEEPKADSNSEAPESFLSDEDLKEDIKYEFVSTESYDPAFIDSYKSIAKDLNLSQENAQKVLDTFSKYETTRANQAGSTWLEQTRLDKEIGGENLEKSKVLVKKALSTFASPELKEFLTKGALGNHPEVIRMLVRVGKSVSEDDTFIKGGSTRQSERDPNQPTTLDSYVVANYSKKT